MYTTVVINVRHAYICSHNRNRYQGTAFYCNRRLSRGLLCVSLLVSTMEFANHKAWQHCNEPGCNQLDFLPFECGDCGKTFCAQHRELDQHDCAKGLRKRLGRVVDTCPDCGQLVTQVSDKTMEASMALHGLECAGNSTTAPSKKKTKKKRKIRCAAGGCKEDISKDWKQFCCRACDQKYCCTHRVETEHNCQGPKASQSTKNTPGNNEEKGDSCAAAAQQAKTTQPAAQCLSDQHRPPSSPFARVSFKEVSQLLKDLQIK